MIQIALFGGAYEILIPKGLDWKKPERLHILYNTRDWTNPKTKEKVDFFKAAKKFAKVIENDYDIDVELHQVDPDDMSITLRTIMKIMYSEKEKNPNVQLYINITDGTKPMTVAGSLAVFLGKKKFDVNAIYVHHTVLTKNKELVTTLPIPRIPINDSRGKSELTTAIVRETLKKMGKATHQMLQEEVRKDPRIKKTQRIEHQLKNLDDNGEITRTNGWTYEKDGKEKKDGRRVTIKLTEVGEFNAEFPDYIDE